MKRKLRRSSLIFRMYAFQDHHTYSVQCEFCTNDTKFLKLLLQKIKVGLLEELLNY
jgi:hypothetical protein